MRISVGSKRRHRCHINQGVYPMNIRLLYILTHIATLRKRRPLSILHAVKLQEIGSNESKRRFFTRREKRAA